LILKGKNFKSIIFIKNPIHRSSWLLSKCW